MKSSYLDWQCCLTPKSHRLANKSPHLKWEASFWTTMNYTKIYCCCPRLPPVVGGQPHCCRLQLLQPQRALRTWHGSDGKASFLRRHLRVPEDAKQGREAAKSPYPAVTPMNNNYQQTTIILRRQGWYTYLGGNQQTSNWSQVLLSKKETVSGTGNLPNYPRTVKSWILEKNRQPSFS